MKHSQNKSRELDKVVVRFAPSPTGFFHVGSARTALFNDLFAKKHGGKFILRIEDTDISRNEKHFEESIMSGLEWLGIKHDEVCHQSKRGDIYKKHLLKMIEEGSAYISKEETGKRSEVIRFKNPGVDITFTDLVRGKVTMNTADLGDFVIARDLDSPLYHLAVSIDDALMGITHVIRGDDGISNTPRQILIQEALGATRPVYAHIPLILAEDRSKLSKRHGAVSVDEYRDCGYLSEAMVNFLALLGWNPGGEKEVFDRSELTESFDLAKVGKGGAIFNQEKLDWFNKEHMKKLPEKQASEEILGVLKEFYDEKVILKILPKLAPILLERISVWNDLREMAKAGELDYFFQKPEYEGMVLINKKDYKKALENDDVQSVTKITKNHIDNIIKLLQKNISSGEEAVFTADKIKEIVWEYAEKEGKGAVLWPMRVALSGQERSPDPFTLAELFGFQETLLRLELALKKLDERI